MNIRTYLLAALVAATLSSSAAVNNTPGALASILTADEAAGASLVVEGPVNAVDFEYLNTLTSLRTLDLSRAVIVEYNGERLLSGIVHSDANRLPDYAFIGSAVTSVTLPTGLTAIGEGAFAGSAITSITIPASVTTIAGGAFHTCNGLKSVAIPSTVTTIGDGLFGGCRALTSAQILTSEIPAQTFRNCPALKTVAASPSITAVGASAFAGCNKLEAFIFPSTLTAIGADAFNGTALKMADLSRCTALTTIGDRAFADCTLLETVYLPTSITSLGTGVFFDDVALETIALPEKLRAIPAHLFKGARNLNAGVVNNLSDSIATIGDYAFIDMAQVNTWRAPSALNAIGDGAMEGWTGLESIDASMVKVVPALGDNVWAGVNQGDIALSVPDNLMDQFMSTPQWQEFKLKLSGINTGIDGDFVDAADITVTLAGSILRAVATGADLETILVHDVNGRAVAALRSIGSTNASLDLSGIAPGVIIVTVETTDGRTSSLKTIYKG